MNCGIRQFLKAARRESGRGLRVFWMLVFCSVNVFIPQFNLRTSEAASWEILPADSAEGQEREEESSSTHALLERSSFSRFRSVIRIRPISVCASQAVPVRRAHGEHLAVPSSFSERVLPLRC